MEFQVYSFRHGGVITFFRLLGAVTFLAVSLSAQSNDARHSLMQAIQRGDTALVSRLIESGISPNVKDDDGVPALMLATLFSDAACVELLLKRGADPNQADTAGATPLMWALPDIQKVRILIEHGANVNSKSASSGRTPLLIAAAYPGTVDLLDLLLARGADLRAKDNAGFTALAMAMRSSDIEVLRFLADKGLDPKGDVPAAALIAVYMRARPAVIDFVMARGLKVPKDILARAANWQRPDLIKQWIEQGADVNVRGGTYGVTPILTATSSEFAGAETLRILLEHGADHQPAANRVQHAQPYSDCRAGTDALSDPSASASDRQGPRKGAELAPVGRNPIGRRSRDAATRVGLDERISVCGEGSDSGDRPATDRDRRLVTAVAVGSRRVRDRSFARCVARSGSICD